jgi:hypothetical protein
MPAALWGLHSTWSPSWLLIDAEGRAVDLLRATEEVYDDSDSTYEALDAMIAAALGE